jgi:hypothetical protein
MSRVRISSPAPFLFCSIVTYVETVGELLVLAIAMFLAAFFCLRVAFIPQSANRAIDKIYEVEETISERRSSTR